MMKLKRLNPFNETIKEAKTDQKRRKQDHKKTATKPRNVDASSSPLIGSSATNFDLIGGYNLL